MSAHAEWALVCRLFSTGTPVMKMRLTASEVAVLPALAKAVKPTSHNVSIVPCPYCGMNGGEVRRSRDGDLECCCAECGAVPVDADDLAALMLDENWLHRRLRAALNIESDGGSVTLAAGAWMLGHAGKTPVVLTRDIRRLWREPGLLDRVRAANSLVHVIAPTHQIAAGVPADAGVEWLALEERFRLRGEAISFLGARGAATTARRRNDPAAPVHGPFSADFRLVYLDGDDSAPIRCTKAQADVFRALWEFEGKDRSAEDVMSRAGRKSAKPIDVFKAHPEPKRAYEALVATNQKEGLYRMPCAFR
ncbi:hypothetical protein [Dokdonella sp.]|uniref:hypothetical protein n=1 Tax=Dokdonella sp. TaxID=2291710 RepID=UPI00321F6B6E